MATRVYFVVLLTGLQGNGTIDGRDQVYYRPEGEPSVCFFRGMDIIIPNKAARNDDHFEVVDSTYFADRDVLFVYLHPTFDMLQVVKQSNGRWKPFGGDPGGRIPEGYAVMSASLEECDSGYLLPR